MRTNAVNVSQGEGQNHIPSLTVDLPRDIMEALAQSATDDQVVDINAAMIEVRKSEGEE